MKTKFQQPTNINDILGNIQRPVENQKSNAKHRNGATRKWWRSLLLYNIPSPFENDMNVNNDLGTYANLVNQQRELWKIHIYQNNFQNHSYIIKRKLFTTEQQSILNIGNGSYVLQEQ